ncbi:hypothetical protein C8F04DRAFT_978481, partial [Mycena alexandri]
LQHPQDTFADLMTLFHRDAEGPEDFPQTLIYTDDRIPVERIQDFLRRNKPDGISEKAFEFYHRHIHESEKKKMQDMIQAGTLRGTAATDALGMVCLLLFLGRCNSKTCLREWTSNILCG